MKKKPSKPIVLKICVFGNKSVGKSTLLNKCFEEFQPEDIGGNLKAAIGLTFYRGKLRIEGNDVVLQIWEISGDEKFHFIFKKYVKGAVGGIFVYDITSKSSLDKVDYWVKEFRKSRKNASIPVLMVGTKLDLKDRRKIKIEQANKSASSNNLIGAFEISSPNVDEVRQLFINFVKMILSIDPKRHVINVFKNEIDLRILILLRIYNELSLAEISYNLGKSKAHISRRTRELIKLGLINSYSKDDEIQPGNIKRKYYSLSQNFKSFMVKKKFDLNKVISNNNWELMLEYLTKYSFEYKKIDFISNHLNRYIEATENLLLTSVAMEKLPMMETIKLITEILENNQIYFSFLSANQHEKVQQLTREFHLKIEKVLESEDNSEKPYLFIDMLLPILSIAKYGGKPGLFISSLRQQAKDSQ